ncbi:MAG: gentisate 1,2-dioxygenase [Candidatus Binataceae bacterium]
MHSEPAKTPEREAFYQKIAAKSMAPLWELLKGIQASEPNAPEVPAIWRYAEVRPMLMEAGALITAREADRRVLVLRNPALLDQYPPRATHSLYAGLQLIMPGEIAPSHRHSQAALRFIVEGEGAYTAVNGEKTMMEPGDFVLTPNWTWHDHGNETGAPMVWMDGLDLAIVDLLNGGFFEAYPEDQFPLDRPENDSNARYGSGMLPDSYFSHSLNSPILNYRYSKTREALDQMMRRGDPDECHGLKMRYINPVNGDWAMPTLGTCMRMLPKGFNGSPYRSTDGTVYMVVEGSGRTVVDGSEMKWREHDAFVVPSWRWHHHEADGEAVLFSFSDRPVQEKLGLFREQRGRA